MRLILLGLFALASAKPNANSLIKINVRHLDPACDPSVKICPRSEAIPEIDIIFPDGRMDSMVLERHYASPEARMMGEKHCNFFGHLKNDASACVAVTGCSGQEDMEFTINSRDLETNMYILRKDGNLEAIQSKLKNGVAATRAMRVDGTDAEMTDNDNVITAEMAMEAKCAAGQCKSIPDKNLMKIKIGYEDSWIGSFGGSTSASTDYINSMVTHMQAFFCLDSLGTKIQLETTGDYTHHAGHTWTADGDDLENHMNPLTQASTADAHLWVYLSKHQTYGYVGLAWVGVLCRTQTYSCSINEKLENIVSTAEVVSHEMGHNMGMLHDFSSQHGGQGGPCDGQGFMSYGSAPQQWSTCSKNDFLAHYNTVVNSGSWCLPYASTACNSAPSPPPPPPPPATGCGSPQWKGDGYCDDDNNNDGCDYDGGDCCGDNVNTQYCTACQCLDPNFGTTAAPPPPGTTAAPPPPGTTAAPSPPPPAGDCASMPTFMQNADRIVGGEAAPDMIPWQVAMLSGSFQFCGGTILDSCTVLTAAHCGIDTSKSIRAGSTNKQNGGQVRGISQVISNPDMPYNSGTINNDWVIVKLDSPLELNDDVQPACLPSADYLPATATEERCFTSGWGTLSSGGSATNNLQYVRVPAITNAQCNSAYGGSITDTMICAGYPGVGGKDACQGDSGGPFVCNDNGNAVIAGVVSWGNGCALADYPGVYARVTSALSWIQNSMGSCGGSPSPPSPTPPSPSPPSPSPPSTGCGSPQWKGDGYCDDENNNDGCDYDGGDCCGDDVNTQYCSACQCLDPEFGDDDDDDDDCQDTKPTAWCENRRDKGKCSKQNIANKCQKTCCVCGDCELPCVDYKSTAWCENKKNKGKCNKNGIKAKCPLTCGVCTPVG